MEKAPSKELRFVLFSSTCTLPGLFVDSGSDMRQRADDRLRRTISAVSVQIVDRNTD